MTMHEKFQKLMRQFADQAGLDPKRKEEIRAQLAAYATANPIVQRSVWARLVSFPMVTAALMIALVVLAGTGTVYASTDAQPGQFLFNVRVYVAEPVAVALTFDQEAKADVELAQVENRILEQEQLTVSGQAEAANKHQELLDKKIARLKERIEKLESKGKSDKALEVASRVEASISVHDRIVAIDRDEDGDGHAEVHVESKTETNGSSSNVSSSVVVDMKGNAEASIKNGDSEAFKDQAQRRIDQAASLIAEVRSYIQVNESALNAELKTKAEVELDKADEQLENAKEKFGENKFSDSIMQSAHASADAQRVKILVTVAVKTENALFSDDQFDNLKNGIEEDREKLKSDIKKKVQDRLDEIFRVQGTADLSSN